MSKNVLLGIFIVLFFNSKTVIASQTVIGNQYISDNISLIDQFYNNKNQNITRSKLISTITEIIKNRSRYSSNTLAKAFSLLADNAMDKGDSARAFQFSQDGLAQGPISPSIKLNLLLKIVEGYNIQGKYTEEIVAANTVIALAKKEQNIPALLNALAYQATAFALIGKYPEGYQKMQMIDELLKKNPSLSNQIKLLQTLAIANQSLGDFDTSITLHLKLLKLQFNSTNQQGIEKTYYNLASAYLKLEKYDDAYNAFWQVKKNAEKKSFPIILAYAELGIGQTLLKQRQYTEAYNSLIKAEKLLKGKNLSKVYLSNLIALAKAARYTNRNFFASQILKKAEILAKNIQLSQDQIELYKMLSDDYQQQENEHQALKLLNKYLLLKKQFTQKKSNIEKLPQEIKHSKKKSKELALKFSKNGTVYSEFAQKNQFLRSIILILVFIVISLIIVTIILWLKHRNYLFHADYIELEQPKEYLSPPIITKKNYHLNYKKARKYNYPITISLISITNWEELSFLFNKRVMKEIENNIANTINNNINEFEHAGKISNGGYLLIFPHQTKSEITETIEKITAELNARIYANLGEFSVIIKIISKTPNIQDIDPFAFLSQLDDLMK